VVVGVSFFKRENNNVTVPTLFLRQLKKLREGRNIVYNDETYLHSSHTSPYGWDDGNGKGLRAPVGKGQRLIILHSGGAQGFVPNELLTFKSGNKTGDYHDDMNHRNYMNGLDEKLIRNLEPNSVLIIDNASHHYVTILPNPTSSWKKANMKEWVNERGISFELYEKNLSYMLKLNCIGQCISYMQLTD
jgi:hypothetical protein